RGRTRPWPWTRWPPCPRARARAWHPPRAARRPRSRRTRARPAGRRPPLGTPGPRRRRASMRSRAHPTDRMSVSRSRSRDHVCARQAPPRCSEPAADDGQTHESDRRLTTFRELGVLPEICDALERADIVTPFAIQEMTLSVALLGTDLIGQAR